MFDFESDWQNASKFLDNQEIIETRVSGLNPGGVIVKFGFLRAFVPRAQLSRFHQLMFDEFGPTSGNKLSAVDQLTAHLRSGLPHFEWIGKQLRVRIVEVDRERQRIILSEKAAATSAAKSASA
jgi:small subunit ribosomal protein S1